MSSRAATAACKPCLNKKYPLRKQLLLSFLALAAVSNRASLLCISDEKLLCFLQCAFT